MTNFNGLVPLWINGKEVVSDTTFDVVSPLTNEKVWSASSVSLDHVTKATSAAHSAFKTWRRTKPVERRTIFLRAADIIDARKEELESYMRRETGALDSFVAHNLSTCAEFCREVASRISSISGSIPQTAEPGTGAFIFKEPFGVNLAIAPWNAPFILGSELSPRIFWSFGSVFQDAGLPDGVLNIIYHQPSDASEITNALIEDPAIKKINFTGSTNVGAIIASKAGKELKPVLLELGGKASAIVCEDADLDKAAMEVARGALMNAGQICMSKERILVNRAVIDRFAQALKGAVEMVYAPSADAPVLAAKAAVEKNKKLMADAVSKGAKVLYGDLETHDLGAYRMRPVVISDVKKETDIYYIESFGPTVSLIAVTDDEEAIEVANDTEYGLSGAIFTESLGRGLRLAKEIESGAVHINSKSVHDEATLPHGGVKKSGWGRFNAEWGMEEFLRIKTVTYME